MWAGAALAGSALAVSAWPAATHWMGGKASTAALDHAVLSSAGTPTSLRPRTSRGPSGIPVSGRSHAAVSLPRSTVPASGHPSRSPAAGRASAAGAAQRQEQRQVRSTPPAPPVYLNPFRSISGLIPERIDMGVDFGGSGPVYALGDAVITNATGNSAGWPGGGWITYRLTNGPAAGLMVYLAEDVTPTVQAGQHVSSSTVIAHMFAGADGIETGWAQPDGSSAESQLPQAGGISGSGPFPTSVGLNFEELLQSLGAPAANNRGDAPYGVLPANYPAGW